MEKTTAKKARKKIEPQDPYKEIMEIIDEYYEGTPPRTRESLED